MPILEHDNIGQHFGYAEMPGAIYFWQKHQEARDGRGMAKEAACLVSFTQAV